MAAVASHHDDTGRLIGGEALQRNWVAVDVDLGGCVAQGVDVVAHRCSWRSSSSARR